MSELNIRLMGRADLDTALGWARDQGWNPGVSDAEAFLAADPTGFFMGWLDGQPVACVSVVKYGANFAFLGLYIVRPEFRGRGFGKAMWDVAVASAGTRIIGLDGVVAQQANYQRSGFALAHRNARYGGVPTALPARAPHVVMAEAAGLDALIVYDAEMFPGPRPEFLRAWLGPAPDRQTLVWREGGAVRGYGTIRAGAQGHKVGPLFADEPGIAAGLFAGLIALARPALLFIDVPETNAAAVSLVRSVGLTPGFETARMYRGPMPDLPPACVFGVTTLELG